MRTTAETVVSILCKCPHCEIFLNLMEFLDDTDGTNELIKECMKNSDKVEFEFTCPEDDCGKTFIVDRIYW